MMTIRLFIKRHPVLTYYVLTFVISGGLALIVMGPAGFLGAQEAPETTLVLAGALGLAGPSVAGILLTGLVYGRAGLRNLLSRFLRWRVGVRWYAVALLTAPLLNTVILLGLSLASPAFLPAIVTATDKTSLLLSGIVTGLTVGFFEELGWTGFAIPELRRSYGVLSTGLIVGLLWGVWHFPLFAGSAFSSATVPPTLYLAVLLFSWLLPYRVLMVWVYDRTESLLVAMLMHVTITANASFILRTPALSEVQAVISLLVWAAVLWVFVAVVAVATRGQLSQQPPPRMLAS
jgi:membrane protease YdiL (CAAX protease family)